MTHRYFKLRNLSAKMYQNFYTFRNVLSQVKPLNKLLFFNMFQYLSKISFKMPLFFSRKSFKHSLRYVYLGLLFKRTCSPKKYIKKRKPNNKYRGKSFRYKKSREISLIDRILRRNIRVSKYIIFYHRPQRRKLRFKKRSRRIFTNNLYFDNIRDKKLLKDYDVKKRVRFLKKPRTIRKMQYRRKGKFSRKYYKMKVQGRYYRKHNCTKRRKKRSLYIVRIYSKRKVRSHLRRRILKLKKLLRYGKAQ